MAAKKKMSMKQALNKYEDSAQDNRMDRAGAKRMMAQTNKKSAKPTSGKRGY